MRTTFKYHNKLGKDIIKTTESQAKWAKNIILRNTKHSWLGKYLKNLEVDASLSFQNIDNTAANARQAIKRFLKKWPGRKFSTKTCKEDHSFTIVRVK